MGQMHVPARGPIRGRQKPVIPHPGAELPMLGKACQHGAADATAKPGRALVERQFLRAQGRAIQL